MFSKKIIFGLLLSQYLLGSQNTDGHGTAKEQELRTSTLNLSCKILTNFSQFNNTENKIQNFTNQTKNFFLKNEKCTQDLHATFKEPKELEEFLENQKVLSTNTGGEFLEKCLEKENSELTGNQKKEVILSFYLNNFLLRQEILKNIQTHSEVLRLQGHTSFFKEVPSLSNIFQSEQLQKVKSISKCSPQDSNTFEINHEIKQVLSIFENNQKMPHEIFELYPILKEKEFSKIIASSKKMTDGTEQALLSYLERKEKENIEDIELKQKILKCLTEESANKECQKINYQPATLVNNIEEFLKIISQKTKLSSCFKEKTKENVDSCSENKTNHQIKSDCEITLMAREERKYRLCKLNQILISNNLPALRKEEVDSFDKNILNEKKSFMGQKWSNLLFLHYKVDPKELSKLIPPPLELDLHNNEAWVSVVPFKMNEIKPGNITNIVPGFPEINVRTYVKYGEQHGVYFLTLDASNRFVVKTSSLFPGLPYKQAKMSHTGEGNHENPFFIKSIRTEKNAPRAEFEATYEVTGEKASPPQDDLSKFLVERYRFFGVSKDGCVIKTDINHEKWPISTASAVIKKNTMLDSFKEIKPISPNPLIQYVHEMDVKVWSPKEVGCEKLE